MPSPIDELRKRLAEFDGRSLTVLGEAEAQCQKHPDYVDALIDLAGEPDTTIATGATWLIKSYLESGGMLSTTRTTALMRCLTDITAWQAQLHICQSARHLTIPGNHADRFLKWLEPLLDHKRPFVRAWAVDALCQIAQQYPRYQERAEKALEAASDDDAASVRARARNIRSDTAI